MCWGGGLGGGRGGGEERVIVKLNENQKKIFTCSKRGKK